MRLAIDIDSTLHPYWDLLAAAARRRFGVELPYETQSTWDIPRLRADQLRVCMADTYRDEAILGAEPYPGAVQTVNRWHDAGHFIHVTSHRDPAYLPATKRWLERIGLRHDDLHCSFDKVARCRELEIDILVDDSPHTIASALEHGITPATLAHPWNRDVCEDEHVLCAQDWAGLAALVDPLLQARRVA